MGSPHFPTEKHLWGGLQHFTLFCRESWCLPESIFTRSEGATATSTSYQWQQNRYITDQRPLQRLDCLPDDTVAVDFTNLITNVQRSYTHTTSLCSALLSVPAIHMHWQLSSCFFTFLLFLVFCTSPANRLYDMIWWTILMCSKADASQLNPSLLLTHYTCLTASFLGAPGKPASERQNQSGLKWGKKWWGFGMAVTSAGPYANQQHLAPDR